jgi:hypothetical protein
MGQLPRSLGCLVPRNARWYDVYPWEDIHFKELHELTKMTCPTAHTQEMNIALRHVDNPKPDWFGVSPGMAQDIIDMLQGWFHNPEGVPLLICGDSEGTVNISGIDVWMWLKKLSP